MFQAGSVWLRSARFMVTLPMVRWQNSQEIPCMSVEASRLCWSVEPSILPPSVSSRRAEYQPLGLWQRQQMLPTPFKPPAWPPVA